MTVLTNRRGAAKLGLVALGLIAAVAIPVGIATADLGSGKPTGNKSDDRSPELETDRTYELIDVAGDVSAKRYWNETLSALECIKAQGLQTFGPYPSADGLNIKYAYESSPKTDEVEALCLPTLMSVGMEFASAPPEAEVNRLQVIRTEIMRCMELKGVDVDGDPGVAGNDAEDLGPHPDRDLEYRDAGLQLAAESHPDEARSCALAVSP